MWLFRCSYRRSFLNSLFSCEARDTVVILEQGFPKMLLARLLTWFSQNYVELETLVDDFSWQLWRYYKKSPRPFRFLTVATCYLHDQWNQIQVPLWATLQIQGERKSKACVTCPHKVNFCHPLRQTTSLIN